MRFRSGLPQFLSRGMLAIAGPPRAHLRLGLLPPLEHDRGLARGSVRGARGAAGRAERGQGLLALLALPRLPAGARLIRPAPPAHTKASEGSLILPATQMLRC